MAVATATTAQARLLVLEMTRSIFRLLRVELLEFGWLGRRFGPEAASAADSSKTYGMGVVAARPHFLQVQTESGQKFSPEGRLGGGASPAACVDKTSNAS
jgi:hypothetical protein